MVNTEEVVDFLENAGVNLEHSGVKGMRWGVRRGLSGHVKTRAIKRKKTEDNLAPSGYDNVYRGRRAKAMNQTLRKAKGKINSGTRILNNDPRFKGKDFKKDSPLRREYYKEYSKMVETQLNAAATLKGNSNRGQYRLNFKYDYESNAFPEVTMKLNSNLSGRVEERKAASEIRKTVGGLKVKHSDDQETDEITLRVIWGPNGEIEEIEDIPDEMFHTDGVTFGIPELDDALEHYGKKGMKWGVRNGRPVPSAPRPKSAATKKPSKGQIGKQKFEDAKTERKKTLSEMSDQELQRAISRMNLERQYNQMVPVKDTRGRSARAADFIAETVKESGQAAIKEVSKEVAKNALRVTLKRTFGQYGDVLLPSKGDKKDDKKDDKKKDDD